MSCCWIRIWIFSVAEHRKHKSHGLRIFWNYRFVCKVFLTPTAPSLMNSRQIANKTAVDISIFSITCEVFVCRVWVSTDQYGSSITVKMLFSSFAIVLSLSEGDDFFPHRTQYKNITKKKSKLKNWKFCYVFVVIFTHSAVILFIDFITFTVVWVYIIKFFGWQYNFLIVTSSLIK